MKQDFFLSLAHTRRTARTSLKATRPDAYVYDPWTITTIIMTRYVFGGSRKASLLPMEPPAPSFPKQQMLVLGRWLILYRGEPAAFGTPMSRGLG